MSIYDYLKQELEGKEFDTYEEYENHVHALISDMESELGKAERWACQPNTEVLTQLDVVVRDIDD